jgi:hypothetical protein
MRLSGSVARIGETNVHRQLIRNPDRKSPLGRSRCRWVDNIKIDLRELGWGVYWIHLPQVRDRQRQGRRVHGCGGI